MYGKAKLKVLVCHIVDATKDHQQRWKDKFMLHIVKKRVENTDNVCLQWSQKRLT